MNLAQILADIQTRRLKWAKRITLPGCGPRRTVIDGNGLIWWTSLREHTCNREPKNSALKKAITSDIVVVC